MCSTIRVLQFLLQFKEQKRKITSTFRKRGFCLITIYERRTFQNGVKIIVIDLFNVSVIIIYFSIIKSGIIIGICRICIRKSSRPQIHGIATTMERSLSVKKMCHHSRRSRCFSPPSISSLVCWYKCTYPLFFLGTTFSAY